MERTSWTRKPGQSKQLFRAFSRASTALRIGELRSMTPITSNPPEDGSREPLLFRQLVTVAEHEIHSICAEMPEQLRNLIDRVPVLLENHPGRERLAEGVERDQLGLFEGVGIEDPGSQHLPRIVLWLGNLWDYCGEDVEGFREEVRVTFLHELGHFLGWDEDDLEQRDLG